MQKVVGSSPIIRSSEPAGNGGFFSSPQTAVKRRIHSLASVWLDSCCLAEPRQTRARGRDNRVEFAKCLKEATMKAEVGDRIVVEAEKVGQSIRTGVVEEVLTPEPPRLRVRWDDGHSTVLAPTGGAAKIEPAKR